MEAYPLHRAVFEGDTRKVIKLLTEAKDDPAAKDKYGNTPLHIGVALGRKEIVELLLAHKAPAKAKNSGGWSPLAEAVSYGDRDLIRILLRAVKFQAKEQIRARKPDLVKGLRNMPDFFLELKWDFHSWIPLVSRLLPSDVCRIHKKGATVRIDSTLVDFNDMRWQRGDVSFIYDGDAPPDAALTILDNMAKAYQRIRREACGDETDEEIEEEVDLMMAADIILVQLSTKNVNFVRAQTGWFFREYKKEAVGKYPAEFYDVGGLVLEAKKRREHLSEDDIARNKQKAEHLSKVGLDPNQLDAPPKRESLKPPPRPNLTWEEYVASDKEPRLSREVVCKETTKSYRATLAMSMDFPLSVETLLNLLEVVAPFKYFSKLRDFVNMKLPPGFPVRVDIPVVPTVTATVTFQDFEFRKDLDDSFFTVPSDYVEDANSTWPLATGPEDVPQRRNSPSSSSGIKKEKKKQKESDPKAEVDLTSLV